jgi:hypothetical protein
LAPRAANDGQRQRHRRNHFAFHFSLLKIFLTPLCGGLCIPTAVKRHEMGKKTVFLYKKERENR